MCPYVCCQGQCRMRKRRISCARFVNHLFAITLSAVRASICCEPNFLITECVRTHSGIKAQQSGTEPRTHATATAQQTHDIAENLSEPNKYPVPPAVMCVVGFQCQHACAYVCECVCSFHAFTVGPQASLKRREGGRGEVRFGYCLRRRQAGLFNARLCTRNLCTHRGFYSHSREISLEIARASNCREKGPGRKCAHGRRLTRIRY